MIPREGEALADAGERSGAEPSRAGRQQLHFLNSVACQKESEYFYMVRYATYDDSCNQKRGQR